jgi:alpha-galactosidase
MMVAMKPKIAWVVVLLFVCGSISASHSSAVHYTSNTMNTLSQDNPKSTPTAIALHLTEKPDSEGLPPKSAWEKAHAYTFDQDWKGENADPGLETEVRVLWTPETLYLRFHCKYKHIFVFPDARADGWRYELWERDVAETFLQPDWSDPFVYREFEVSPNGYWIDLAVSHGKIEELHSGLKRRVVMDEKNNTWTAELAIPMKYLTTAFDPKHPWKANFYRIEGETEPRFYAAWSPTFSPKPNFHVPSAFGTLKFQE